MKKPIFILLISFFALGFVFNNCSLKNETQKPSHYFENTSTVGNPLAPASSSIIAALCERISTCISSISHKACESKLLATPGFSTALALRDSLTTFESMINAEASGELMGVTSELNLCKEDIGQISCGDIRLQSHLFNDNAMTGATTLVSGLACGKALIPVSKYTCSGAEKTFFVQAKNLPIGPAVPAAGFKFSISPELPPGLTIDANTGVISGTPTVLAKAQIYTITARSESGVVSTDSLSIKTSIGWIVDDLADDDDADLSDGLCLTANGKCTLRAAMSQTKFLQKPRKILLPPGRLKINSSLKTQIIGLEIIGDCSKQTIIDGQGLYQAFIIENGPTTLANLTIENAIHDTSGKMPGGAISIVSGTVLGMTVSLVGLTMRNNSNGESNANIIGGAVYASAPAGRGDWVLNIFDSNFTDNGGDSVTEGGAVAILPGVLATIRNSSFSRNHVGPAGSGAAISSHARALNIESSVVFGHDSGTSAVHIFGDSTSQANFINTTFYQNTGGLHLQKNSAASINNSTFAENVAPLNRQGSALAGNGSVSIANTIFAKNRNLSGTVENCDSLLLTTSRGHNLSDGIRLDCSLNEATDLSGTDALLAPFLNYGGLHSSLALLPTSPALSAGDLTLCPLQDQRGAARSQSGPCDIGSFESP